MPQELGTAFLLMIVGMITVFTILLLVVLTGKSLIYLVNKFAPERQSLKSPAYRLSLPKDSINKKQIAVILAAVEVATKAQGKVTSIKKIRP